MAVGSITSMLRYSFMAFTHQSFHSTKSIFTPSGLARKIPLPCMEVLQTNNSNKIVILTTLKEVFIRSSLLWCSGLHRCMKKDRGTGKNEETKRRRKRPCEMNAHPAGITKQLHLKSTRARLYSSTHCKAVTIGITLCVCV